MSSKTDEDVRRELLEINGLRNEESDEAAAARIRAELLEFNQLREEALQASRKAAEAFRAQREVRPDPMRAEATEARTDPRLNTSAFGARVIFQDPDTGEEVGGRIDDVRLDGRVQIGLDDHRTVAYRRSRSP